MVPDGQVLVHIVSGYAVVLFYGFLGFFDVRTLCQVGWQKVIAYTT